MQDTQVTVIEYSNNDVLKRTSIGTLDFTDVQGQAYNFTFDTVCGSMVELGVKHEAGHGYTHQACISLAEIEVYQRPGEI